MAGITTKELSARRQRLLDELPNHGWDYVKAGIAVGYSPSYARARLKKYAMKDGTFCQQVTARRREIEARTEDLREEATRRLANIMRDPQTKPGTAIKAIDTLGKMNGWHSQTTVLESGPRQQQLNEAERAAARRLAELYFRPDYALAGNEPQPGGEEGTSPKLQSEAPFPRPLCTVPEKNFGPENFSGTVDDLNEAYAEGAQKNHERAQPAPRG